MKSTVESWPDNVDQLKALLREKDLEIDRLKQSYQQILEQFRLAQQHRFGKSREASPDCERNRSSSRRPSSSLSQATACSARLA